MHIQAVPEPTHLPESGPSCSQGQKRDLGFSETGGEPWGARAVGQAGRPSFSMRGPCPVWTLENLRPGPGWALGAPCPAPHTTPNTHLQEEAHLGHTLVLRDEVLEEQVVGLQALLVQHLVGHTAAWGARRPHGPPWMTRHPPLQDTQGTTQVRARPLLAARPWADDNTSTPG